MSVKLNPAYRSVDKIGYGKGATTGVVPANNIPSLGIVGTASSPKEISSVKAIARQPGDNGNGEECDPEDDDCIEERKPRRK
jgi:hypothetical protein